MLKQTLNQVNRWALRNIGHDWLDYLASNTMTDFNRWANNFIWTYDLKAQVVAVKDEARDTKTFTLMPNQRWQGMNAGQYVELVLDIDGEVHHRCYSLSPLVDGCFTITVKKVEGGKVSNWLHQQLQVGDVIQLNHPQGSFHYRNQDKLLFICAGSGITPCYSMISDLQANAHGQDIQVYAQFSRADDVIFADALQQWRTRGIKVDVALSQLRDAADVAPLDADNFLELFPDFRQRDIYLCGPEGFMDKVITSLQMYGYDMDHLHCERFVSQQFQLQEGSFNFADVQPEICFNHLNKSIQLTEADQGKTLLELAEHYGVQLESGCRKGMCGSCKLTLKEGKVAGNQIGNAVYLCSSYPDSARVVLDS